MLSVRDMPSSACHDMYDISPMTAMATSSSISVKPRCGLHAAASG
jgi:hypothetical protein